MMVLTKLNLLVMILKIKILTLTVVIICVFKQGYLFYPQVYLDDALYQL